jgi:hypothetical protein
MVPVPGIGYIRNRCGVLDKAATGCTGKAEAGGAMVAIFFNKECIPGVLEVLISFVLVLV